MKLTAKKYTLSAAVLLASMGTFAHAADDGLIVFDWAGYEDPGLYQKYIDQHGDAPTYAFFGDEEEAFQKMRSGFRADVSHPCSQSVSKWKDAGLIEPLDTSRIERWDDVNVGMKEAFKFGDDYYMLPMDWGTTALTYRADLVDEADIQSLQAFVDPKFEGRTSIGDNVDDAYALAYLATGTTDWSKATEDDYVRASEWLRKAHANVRSYWIDGAELSQLMSSGEVLVSWAWNETPTTMSSEGFDVVANRSTTEGSSSWFCGYVNLTDGPNGEDKVYDFFNAWLDPSSTDYIVSEWGYGHGNEAEMVKLGGETLEGVGLGSVDVPVLAQIPMDSGLREKMIAEFEKIKAGF